ncbi:AAA domain-containing protein [Hydrogenoanaerobacterium saccharovorans]|uniref:AAA domain-containing protein n=1 Tax=Hydrogenoanaerobacterium saccharovorans TaxID=474960 RepID=A0A1H8D203_9FIRM|nr:AAA family ATPase [Hydrogenoanaerobacterium saccharovorans]RPF43412.1 AAA domain-containing protein [Hydrogenoanaerobacterium saccharovorans]SEN00618.1 AAA domain-containing protein [Hydrogenoanaerobacterium saccharovorans]
MGKSLNKIAQELKDSNKKVQLIYAFNGTGKTRLSKEFRALVDPKADSEETGLESKKILYYNAFTEDLFYWDNDLDNDSEPKLKIQPNVFTHWVFVDQGQENNSIDIFQHYTDERLTPHFNADHTFKDDEGKDVKVSAFSEVTFSYERGNNDSSNNIKISKGEESCFIWSVFYSLLEQVTEVLNIDKDSIYQERETDKFDNLKYVFIDDPVTSLDENHLIQIAVDLAKIIKDSKSELKFIITTHNPLFYNVLSNEFNNKNKQSGYNPNKHFKKYCLTKNEDLNYELNNSNDSPFSYHLFLLDEIETAIETEQIYKYHFSFLRNILEKTATFLGYDNWGDLLTPVKGERESYIKRILNLSSHSKHSAEEIVMITDGDKRMLKNLVQEISKIYKFNIKQNTHVKEK